MPKKGFTIIETLVALAVLAVLLTLAALGLRVPSAQLMSNDLQALIYQARLQAVKHNRPVAVTWNATSKSFAIRYNNAATGTTLANTCTATTIIQTISTSDYRNITVSGDLTSNSLVWLPSGLLSTCNGPATTPFGYTISDGRTTRTLTVSLVGKVAIQ
jgi:prepilin-type N-terminal cleavage/methylation domain-containing protein